MGRKKAVMNQPDLTPEPTDAIQTHPTDTVPFPAPTVKQDDDDDDDDDDKTPGKKVKAADIIKAALVDNKDVTLAEVLQRLDGAGVSYKHSSVQSALSTHRSRLKGGEAPRQRARAAVSTGPSLDHLFAVKALADNHGGAAALAETVATVKRLADEVGGIDNLNQCLEALARLMK